MEEEKDLFSYNLKNIAYITITTSIKHGYFQVLSLFKNDQSVTHCLKQVLTKGFCCCKSLRFGVTVRKKQVDFNLTKTAVAVV